jgi:hypothetical protein
VSNALDQLHLETAFSDIEEEEEPLEYLPPRGGSFTVSQQSTPQDEGIDEDEERNEDEEMNQDERRDDREGMDDDEWELDYDVDDLREQQELETAGHQIEEEGESDLDSFSDQTESEEDESDSRGEVEDPDGSDHEESQDGHTSTVGDGRPESPSSVMEIDQEEPPPGDE